MTKKDQERTFTAKEVAEIIERQRTLEALEHAINRGKAAGDYPGLIQPLVNLFNAINGAAAPQPETKTDEPADEKRGEE
jgi:hypothetical protein